MDGNILKYTSTESLRLGTIVELHSGVVGISLDGRLGRIRLPKRMIISQEELAIGQRVGFLMSYPEVLVSEA